MHIQWNLIWGLLFALIVALFAVLNVEGVSINYLFGQAEIPLIIVIIGSALLGGLVVGLFGIVRQYKLQWEIKKLKKELANAVASAPDTLPAAASGSAAEAAGTESEMESAAGNNNGDIGREQLFATEDSGRMKQ